MGKPSIGEAITPVIEQERKKEIKELTVLKEDSKESMFYLIFSETETGGMK